MPVDRVGSAGPVHAGYAAAASSLQSTTVTSPKPITALACPASWSLAVTVMLAGRAVASQQTVADHCHAGSEDQPWNKHQQVDRRHLRSFASVEYPNRSLLRETSRVRIV